MCLPADNRSCMSKHASVCPEMAGKGKTTPCTTPSYQLPERFINKETEKGYLFSTAIPTTSCAQLAWILRRCSSLVSISACPHDADDKTRQASAPPAARVSHYFCTLLYSVSAPQYTCSSSIKPRPVGLLSLPPPPAHLCTKSFSSVHCTLSIYRPPPCFPRPPSRSPGLPRQSVLSLSKHLRTRQNMTRQRTKKPGHGNGQHNIIKNNKAALVLYQRGNVGHVSVAYLAYSK